MMTVSENPPPPAHPGQGLLLAAPEGRGSHSWKRTTCWLLPTVPPPGPRRINSLGRNLFFFQQPLLGLKLLGPGAEVRIWPSGSGPPWANPSLELPSLLPDPPSPPRPAFSPCQKTPTLAKFSTQHSLGWRKRTFARVLALAQGSI